MSDYGKVRKHKHMKTYRNIDEYLKDVPKEYRAKVGEMRVLAGKLAPDGVETISYGMPTIKLNGKNLIHFAGMKGHLGFYPAPSGVQAYEEELIKRGISYAKGCIRFSYEKPLPVALIKKIILFRIKEERKRTRC